MMITWAGKVVSRAIHDQLAWCQATILMPHADLEPIPLSPDRVVRDRSGHIATKLLTKRKGDVKAEKG